MLLSIIVKSFNEEKNIERVIKSALQVLEVVSSGEVIIADSLSTDNTIPIASNYPVKIVQLANKKDRSCGVGAELGYRYAKGKYLFFIDADMEINLDFVNTAISMLEKDISVVGIGGIINEMNINNAEFRGRVKRNVGHLKPGNVDRLNGGGIFRKKDIDTIGYFTNRNLHAYEEYELALRIRQINKKLIRLDKVSVNHYGHTDSSINLLFKRWNSRYTWGGGELIKQTWSHTYFLDVLRDLKIYRNSLVILVWLSLLIILSYLSISVDLMYMYVLIIMLLLPLITLSVKRRSVYDGLIGLFSLIMTTVGIIAGLFFSKNIQPIKDIKVVMIK
ncbi:MAG: glycosyltransferase [Candidatus Thiodiazotropha endolucinida]|nr:glycosyltransferase [Candidatus Thiodiazotropha taylori]MCG8096265.1 glycosyltransferase [Candidatus Thiodiazotropha endolucinida]MCW4315069.1 glycosyltransferase [Candidatus Thiodiazotropha taylori]